MAKKLTIDGKDIMARDDATIIQAAHEAGIAIPHYCYHPKLSIAGNCRMCLVEFGTPAIGPDRNLYLCEFAGAGQQATDPLIDKITLDANGDGVVTASEIAALTDNCSVDFYLKGQANTSSFNAIDIAGRIEAAIRQNSGLIAEQILAGESEPGDEADE